MIMGNLYLKVFNMSYDTWMVQQTEDLCLLHTFLYICMRHANKRDSLDDNLRGRVRSNLCNECCSIRSLPDFLDYLVFRFHLSGENLYYPVIISSVRFL